MTDGDAGNNFLQSIVSVGGDTDGGMTESEVNAFAEGAKGLRQMAESGGWAISEEGGTHFRKAVQDAQYAMGDLKHRMRRLSEKPNLGEDDYANQVATHMHHVLDSDEQSLLPASHKFQTGLDDMYTAIEMAIKNFNAEDESATNRFGSFNKEG